MVHFYTHTFLFTAHLAFCNTRVNTVFLSWLISDTVLAPSARHKCAGVNVHVCVCTCMYVMYVCMCLCYVCVQVCMCMCLCVCVCIRVYVCMCVCMYMYVCRCASVCAGVHLKPLQMMSFTSNSEYKGKISSHPTQSLKPNEGSVHPNIGAFRDKECVMIITIPH